MAEKKSEQESPEVGEQIMLIDIAPENIKPIIKAAKLYKRAQSERLAALKEEVKYKTEVRELVRKSNPQQLEDGDIKFEYDGFEVIITPQDEKVTVKDKAINAID